MAKKKAKLPDIVTAPPFYDPRRDGVTQGLLGQFMFCRERARIGLKGWTRRAGSMGSTFGNLMHAALEFLYDDVRTKALTGPPSDEHIARTLLKVEGAWRRDNPLADANDTQFFEQGMLLCAGVLPQYVKAHVDDFTKTTWLSLEHQFCVTRILLPPVGPIPFRGKMDGIYQHVRQPRLLETKTRGHIDEAEIVDILPMDRQVMAYLMALRMLHKKLPSGVTYNIVRRPQLRQKIGESFAQFANRVSADIADRPDWYFVRMEMDIEAGDIDRFELELDDLITDFVDWWDGRSGHYRNSDNCHGKYGPCEALPICARRDFTTFFKRPTVFRELEEM